MKLSEVIAEAIDTNNAQLAGQVADVLRFRYGMNYATIYQTVCKVRPVTEAQWDALLYEADSCQE